MMMVKNSVVVALVSMLVSQGAVGAVPNPADGAAVSYARPGQVGPAKEPVPKKQIVVENKSSKPSAGGATDAIAPAGVKVGASGEGSLDDLDEPETKASRASKVYTKPEAESEPASGDGSLEEDDNSPVPPTKPTSDDGGSGDDDLSGSDDIDIPNEGEDGFNWGNEPAPEGAVNSPTTDADNSDDKDAANESKGDGEKGDDDDSDSDSDDEGDYDEETGEYKKPSVVTEPPTKSADPYAESSSSALSTESDSYARPSSSAEASSSSAASSSAEASSSSAASSSAEASSSSAASSSAEASSSSAASSSAVPSGDGDLGYKRPESSTPGAAKETDTPTGDGGSEDKLKYKRPETPAPEGDGKKDDKDEKSEGYLDMFKNWYNKNYGSKSTAASS